VPLEDLLEDVASVLGPAVGPTFRNPAAVWDLFEVWVFSRLLEAARVEGYTIDFRDVHGAAPPEFIFRTSPGRIAGAHPYCHAVITHPGVQAMELHQGVFVQGVSKTPHECDVVLLLQTVAAESRRRGIEPGCRGVEIAVECKFLAGQVRLHMLREFIGLCAELGRKPVWFATNSTSGSLQAVLTRHKLQWEDEMGPGLAATQRLVHAFRTLLDHLKP
jgi:hypothetical protein